MSEWLEHSVLVDVDVPVQLAWDLWSDLEQMPRWMRWIDSVTVLPDDPDLSRWKLASGGFEFTWLSRITSLVPLQIIQWESVDGLPNRGAIRFYDRKAAGTTVKLTVAYAVPTIIQWMDGLFLGKLVETNLQRDLDTFRQYAEKAHQQA